MSWCGSIQSLFVDGTVVNYRKNKYLKSRIRLITTTSERKRLNANVVLHLSSLNVWHCLLVRRLSQKKTVLCCFRFQIIFSIRFYVMGWEDDEKGMKRKGAKDIKAILDLVNLLDKMGNAEM